MKRIDELFNLHRAKSDIYSRYNSGEVPYVGNGLSDNAVVGLIKPLPNDRVFDFTGIVVSAFCEATVQVPPFVACGRAGNGLVVLEPKRPMKIGQLAYIAAYINSSVRWRFSWYWQTTADRLGRLTVPDKSPKNIEFRVNEYLPDLHEPQQNKVNLRLEKFALGAIFNLKPGDYHSVGHLPAGTVPVVSCGDLDNGVCGYFQIEKHVYEHLMTIAFNGATLSAKYHPYKFAAKDDVAVCTPKEPHRLTTLLFIQLMLQRERWRFSYYRKCYREKLERVTIPLPSRNGKIDEDAIENVMRATPYWKYLHKQLHPSIT